MANKFQTPLLLLPRNSIPSLHKLLLRWYMHNNRQQRRATSPTHTLKITIIIMTIVPLSLRGSVWSGSVQHTLHYIAAGRALSKIAHIHTQWGRWGQADKLRGKGKEERRQNGLWRILLMPLLLLNHTSIFTNPPPLLNGCMC